MYNGNRYFNYYYINERKRLLYFFLFFFNVMGLLRAVITYLIYKHNMDVYHVYYVYSVPLLYMPLLYRRRHEIYCCFKATMSEKTRRYD